MPRLRVGGFPYQPLRSAGVSINLSDTPLRVVDAYRVTDAAKWDFRMVLKEPLERFGTHQREAYKRLIVEAVTMVAEEPGRGGSRDGGPSSQDFGRSIWKP